jgi:hypothetical protein
MQRRIAYLIVTFITFSLGISAVWLCDFIQGKDINRVDLDENVVLLAAPPAKQRFTPTFRACKPGWKQGYISSDGERVSESGNGFSSVALANRELRKWVRQAEKKVERTAKLDSEGKRVGDRVVAIFPVNENGIKWVSIMWTDRRVIRSINAPSLQLALELEKTLHNQMRNMLER